MSFLSLTPAVGISVANLLEERIGDVLREPVGFIKGASNEREGIAIRQQKTRIFSRLK